MARQCARIKEMVIQFASDWHLVATGALQASPEKYDMTRGHLNEMHGVSFSGGVFSGCVATRASETIPPCTVDIYTRAQTAISLI